MRCKLKTKNIYIGETKSDGKKKILVMHYSDDLQEHFEHVQYLSILVTHVVVQAHEPL